MGPSSHRLKGPIAGALAGGGDPATSPLYVFGPFLTFLVASGAGAACFGASIWLVVATVIAVSLMYRKVMGWITDGSGGSGLCEEEFGSWAVKINAAITFIEYTLTFLVSIAALVTFVADRAPILSNHWARVGLAIGMSILTGAVVNRGPKVAARVFGPATAAVLVLLWVLVVATIVERGLVLPELRFEAFRAGSVGITLNGYVRLLALMTGIEVFANLVAAYEGNGRERARLAFGSLLIVMGTTLATMLVVGPAILALSSPARTDVSVFTQTMDQLLPAPLPYVGSLIGIFVLLSAAAASAQGLQNLSLGLRHRHYLPAAFGQRNRHDVADRPVWLQVGVVCGCFIVLGTGEETYLGLYAAGVFVLLSLTALASVKRLTRGLRERVSLSGLFSLSGTLVAAVVTTGSAVLIFVDRMREGAWAYGILVPTLAVGFGVTRKRLGEPTNIEERLGRVLAEHRVPSPSEATGWPSRILAIVDGSAEAEVAVIAGAGISARFQAPLYLCIVGSAGAEQNRGYGEILATLLSEIPSMDVPTKVDTVADVERAVRRVSADLIIAASDVHAFRALPKTASVPILLLCAKAPARLRYSLFERIVVGVDGSEASEVSLPLVRSFLRRGSRVTVAAIADGGTEDSKLPMYAATIVSSLGNGAIDLELAGSGPARTLARVADERDADLVVVASHGRGGIERRATVELGSVPTRLISDLVRPLLVVPSTLIPAFEGISPGVVRSRS